MNDPEELHPPDEDLSEHFELALEEPAEEVLEPVDQDEELEGPPGPLLSAATAWADEVLILAVCALAVAGARLFGYPVEVSVLPWAGGLGVLAWWVSSMVLLVTRRSWPGALVLGLVLAPERGTRHWLRRLLAVTVGVLSLGLVSAMLCRVDPWSGLVPESRA